MWGRGAAADGALSLNGLFQPGMGRNSGAAEAGAEPSSSGSFPADFDGSSTATRRVRVRKVRAAGGPQTEEFQRHAERRIAEIIPGLADLSLEPEQMDGALRTARDIRLEKLKQQQATLDEIKELEEIYDMSKPNAVDDELPPEGWEAKLRPTPRRVQLSSYEYEMINYQRMLMRKPSQGHSIA